MMQKAMYARAKTRREILVKVEEEEVLSGYHEIFLDYLLLKADGFHHPDSYCQALLGYPRSWNPE